MPNFTSVKAPEVLFLETVLFYIHIYFFERRNLRLDCNMFKLIDVLREIFQSYPILLLRDIQMSDGI